MLYVLLIALARLGVGSAVLWTIGYENVRDTGRVVVSVDEVSRVSNIHFILFGLTMRRTPRLHLTSLSARSSLHSTTSILA